MDEQKRMTITTGMMLGDRYQIVRLIGEGGMALVYLAVDRRTGRDVAVKVLKSELAQDEEFVRRFDVEAKAASSLSHPNIVKVLGVGEENGVRYMIQEYIEGTTLKDLIDHYGRLDWRVAVPIGLQVAMALENAHAAGIVHRDIKPHNIMVTPDRRALVTDFGIARASTSSTITLMSGNAMGSVHYFSPEQARGGLVGEKADIYSLGIVFYEMLTGDVPFDGDTPVAVAIKHLQEEPVAPIDLVADIPQGLSDIVMKCIRKSPSERYKNARELINELDAFMLDPAGVYGVIDYAAAMLEQTQQVEVMPEASDFSHIEEIEENIRRRTEKKRREKGLIIAAVSASVILVLVAVVYLVRSAFNGQTAADFIVQDYTGQPVSEVERLLNEAGVGFKKTFQPSAEVEKDYIIDQKPKAGTSIKPNGLTKIELIVSEGAESIRLPDYGGKPYVSAMSELQNKGYRVETVFEENDDVEINQVIRTDPPAGTILEAGQTVTLYVSSGEKKVTVPNLKGKDRETALRMIEELGLVADIKLLRGNPNLAAADQYVISFSPASGSLVEPKSTIYINFGSYTDAYPELTTTTTPPTTAPTESEQPPLTSTTEPPTTPSVTPPSSPTGPTGPVPPPQPLPADNGEN